ncbi:hypothetical protein BYT27DRAFT_7213853 [Phlegmacium glaucopus]|nr:hypothetical protein BYT27DRAFT_7213853 [Phlegmacium glaucopus]
MSKEYLEKVHDNFISPTGTCKILIATSGESVGIDFPNVKIVCTVGLPTNIVDALQWGGRAIQIGDEPALFVVFYKSWALEINLREYIDGNGGNNIDDPDRWYTEIHLVQCPTCLCQFYGDYLDDKSATVNYTSEFCCDRHGDEFNLQIFLPGTIYKATGEKQKADTQADVTSAKLQPKANQIILDSKITEWLKGETAQDPIGRPYYHILSDDHKKALVRITSKDLHSATTIMEALEETKEWGTQWADKLFHLISKHDMATKAAASKAKAQTAKAHKVAASSSGFIIATPDTYLNPKASTSETTPSRKKTKLN